jgi:N-acetylglucosamine-6-phosphate deacetylase
MTSQNAILCFTNCLLPQEDGTLLESDLWIDETSGTILDAQKTFYLAQDRPSKIIDLRGNILSPGLLDIQINGGYGFDFSVYDGDDQKYQQGLELIAKNIVETGVTSLLPTLITQEKSLYPKILTLLKPLTAPTSATLLGWHAEGPFIQMAKRGAHAPPFIITAPEGFKTFEDVYGAENLADSEDWLMGVNGTDSLGVRMITAAPEIEGVMPAVGELSKRGVVFSIGHSIATTDIAAAAVCNGASLITHLFNAMPQLHHRDPSIIGLLGASPHFSDQYSAFSSLRTSSSRPRLDRTASKSSLHKATSEALDDVDTPPMSPSLKSNAGLMVDASARKDNFQRPFYGLIVDGIHIHPNSVRLAYSAFPAGCVLVTDAMKILDPNLRDGIHEWRDGKRFIKEGDKLYLEGTDTLAGSVVTLDKCIRNFVKFTGCSIGEAIKCATYNPARCLGIEDKKGTLRAGADADLVVLDNEGKVLSTWVGGKLAWGSA